MKSFNELLNLDDPGIDLIRDWIQSSDKSNEILPPSEIRVDTLTELQVTTRSTLGAIAYDTGGLLIDNGWIRFWGSGHERCQINVADFNRGRVGFFVFANDAAGGFFCFNGGDFNAPIGEVYYLSPDNIEWEPIGCGYTDTLYWLLTSDLSKFYQGIQWPGWQDDVAKLSGDKCFNFAPFLWVDNDGIQAKRYEVSISEAFELKLDIMDQLSK